jgi:hypothetical protein
MVSARVADYLAGYARGKAEEQKRIWEACVRDVEGDSKRPLWLHELRTFIFGGGELPSMKEATASDNPVVQVGEKHWRIRDGHE